MLRGQVMKAGVDKKKWKSEFLEKKVNFVQSF